jgi:hypothetical protein
MRHQMRRRDADQRGVGDALNVGAKDGKCGQWKF